MEQSSEILSWIWNNVSWIGPTIIIPIIVALVRKFRKPKIDIQLLGDPYENRRNPDTGFDFKWAQVDVVTKSKKTIKNCRAYINRIQYYNREESSKNSLLLDTSLDLAWKGTDSEYSTELSKEVNRKVYLYRFTNDGLEFSRDSLGRRSVWFGEKGEYEIEVKCIGDNAKSAQLTLTAKFEKNHKTPILEVSN